MAPKGRTKKTGVKPQRRIDKMVSSYLKRTFRYTALKRKFTKQINKWCPTFLPLGNFLRPRTSISNPKPLHSTAKLTNTSFQNAVFPQFPRLPLELQYEIFSHVPSPPYHPLPEILQAERFKITVGA